MTDRLTRELAQARQSAPRRAGDLSDEELLDTVRGLDRLHARDRQWDRDRHWELMQELRTRYRNSLENARRALTQLDRLANMTVQVEKTADGAYLPERELLLITAAGEAHAALRNIVKAPETPR